VRIYGPKKFESYLPFAKGRHVIHTRERKRCALQETYMLSPHEFATLMLVKDATPQSDFDPQDLLALADRQFITIGAPPQTCLQPRLTERGHALLARLGSTLS
jgi:hypothetical protein